MGSLFRPKITRYIDPATRKRVAKSHPGALKVQVESRMWWGAYIDQRGQKRRESLGVQWEGPSKTNERAAAAKLFERESQAGQARKSRDPSDRFADHRDTPLLTHLQAYAKYLRDKNNSERHVHEALRRLEIAFAACQFASLVDLDGDRIMEWLAEKRRAPRRRLLGDGPAGMVATYAKVAEAFRVKVSTVCYWRKIGAPIAKREKGQTKRAAIYDLALINEWLAEREQSGGLSITTSNHYIRACGAFGRWLVRSRRSPHNPLAHLGALNAAPDRRHERRTLAWGEFQRLIDATAGSPRSIRGVTGSDRAMLYTVAAFTGLRANELATLTVAALDLSGDPPSLTVKAAYSKRRRKDRQPLRPDLAAELGRWLEDRRREKNLLPYQERPHAELLWPGTWSRDAAEMLRVDLEAAGIPYRDDDGRVFDFHSLRHHFISSLAASGVLPKAAQELARHSTITLTMDRYTHLQDRDKAAALEQLPALPSPRPSRHKARLPFAAGAESSTPPDFGCAGCTPACESVSRVDASSNSGPRSVSRENMPQSAESQGVGGGWPQVVAATENEEKVPGPGVEPGTSRSTIWPESQKACGKTLGNLNEAKRGCADGCTTSDGNADERRAKLLDLWEPLAPSDQERILAMITAYSSVARE